MTCLNNAVVDSTYKWLPVLVRGIKKKPGVFGIELNPIFVLCAYYFGTADFFLFFIEQLFPFYNFMYM